MLTLQEALDAAAKFLAQNYTNWRELRVMPESTVVRNGWAAVPYNSIAYLDEGQKMKFALGNDPITVDLTTGAARFMTWDEQEELWPRAE